MGGPTAYLGLALITLALYAFAKMKSEKSLIFWMGSGITLIFAATLMADPKLKIGSVLGLIITSALGYKFFHRYQQTKRVMPAGLMAGVSALYSVGYVSTLL